MDCSNCGAPLKAKSNICTFCGTLNDTDLRAIGRSAPAGTGSARDCPRCEEPMRTIDFGVEGGFYVERCEKCLGMFFDPGELETVVGQSVSHVYEIDFERMATIVEEESPAPPPVRYVKCPECALLMNRRSYGARSGVVLDTCKEHGVWVDGGELGQILKWVKAGGQLHEEKKQQDRERKEERKRDVPQDEVGKRWASDGLSSFGSDNILLGVVRSLSWLMR